MAMWPTRLRERRLVEDLRDQAHVLVDEDLPAVADRDAGRLLAAVLQGVQAEVGELGDVLARRPHPEHATGVLGALVLRVERQRQPAVAAPACDRSARGVRHGLSLGAGRLRPDSARRALQGADWQAGRVRHPYECQIRRADLHGDGTVGNVLVRRLPAGGPPGPAAPPRHLAHARTRGEGLVVVRTVVDYVRPIRLADAPLVVDTWVCELRAASFTVALRAADRGGCPRPGDHGADPVRLRRPDGRAGSRPTSGRGCETTSDEPPFADARRERPAAWSEDGVPPPDPGALLRRRPARPRQQRAVLRLRARGAGRGDDRRASRRRGSPAPSTWSSRAARWTTSGR